MKVLRYPLGNSLFAYVNTRAGKTLINIRHFKTKLVKSKKHPKLPLNYIDMIIIIPNTYVCVCLCVYIRLSSYPCLMILV